MEHKEDLSEIHKWISEAIYMLKINGVTPYYLMVDRERYEKIEKITLSNIEKIFGLKVYIRRDSSDYINILSQEDGDKIIKSSDKQSYTKLEKYWDSKSDKICEEQKTITIGHQKIQKVLSIIEDITTSSYSETEEMPSLAKHMVMLNFIKFLQKEVQNNFNKESEDEQ